MEPLSIFLWGTAAATSGGALFCLGVRQQIRRAVGMPRHARCPVARTRWIHSVAVLSALVAFFALEPGARWPAALILAATLAIVWWRPGFDDHVFGTDGVRRGWFARRFDELEEWRLTGEHLRWRLYGVWLATEVPPELHAELRAHLETIALDRQSRFER